MSNTDWGKMVDDILKNDRTIHGLEVIRVQEKEDRRCLVLEGLLQDLIDSVGYDYEGYEVLKSGGYKAKTLRQRCLVDEDWPETVKAVREYLSGKLPE